MSFDELVSRQAGVVSRAQVLGLGMSPRTVTRRLASGAWDEMHRSVYLIGGHRVSDEVRVRAAWLWAGGGPAVVTGPAAAWWHGMHDRAPAEIEVTVPRSVRLRPPAGVDVRRRDLTPIDCSILRGLGVADRPSPRWRPPSSCPTARCSSTAPCSATSGSRLWYRAYCRNLGRRGSAEAGRLITAAADRADSAAERLLMTILREAGVMGWVVGHPFGLYLVDLAFPNAKVAIEVDGWAWHVDPVRFRNDRRKGNLLTRAGWSLLRFHLARPRRPARGVPGRDPGDPGPRSGLSTDRCLIIGEPTHDRQEWSRAARFGRPCPLLAIMRYTSPPVRPFMIAESGHPRPDVAPPTHSW